MHNSTEIDAVISLVPNALFHTGSKGIVWHKENALPQPTQAEIDAELSRLNNNTTITEKIRMLETQQTPRLMREALAGISFAVSKMAQIDAEIAALRLQLK